MSTFEDTMELPRPRRRRLFSSRLKRRRLRGRHILGGILLAGAATAALSTAGHHEASQTPPRNADAAVAAAPAPAAVTAQFSTVQQPVEQILAEPRGADAAPIALPTSPQEQPPPQATPTASDAAAVLDPGGGASRITAGPVPLSATTRWGTQTPELEQAAVAAGAAAAAPPAPAAERAAAASAATPTSAPVRAAEPAPKPATAHAANASAERKRSATPARATAPRAAATATGGAWRIQLAAVHSEAAANDAWGRLKRAHPDLLGSLVPTTSRAVLGGAGQLFRVQAGGFHDRSGADRVCSALRRHDVACVIVNPR